MQNDKDVKEQSATTYLIVGLGNPGDAYVHTRHNVGFEVLKSFALSKGFTFRHASDLMGECARADIGGKKVFLLLPTTYMNSSGDAVRRCVDYYKIPADHLLVVCDDVALPLGTMRIRAQGSAGGHNGLKSIEAHLGTNYYARFRIGVGSGSEPDLADHVLGRFLPEEKKVVAEIVKEAQTVLDLWISDGIAVAMQRANSKLKEQLGE